MTRRPGLSLTEVLVAVFITGIGTIAVLTLFPLGALNMAQAFRDDRCTQASYQADAYLRAYVRTASDLGRLSGTTGEKFYEALNDPDPKKAATNYMPAVGGSVPSYPVIIDPLGYRARGGTNDAPTNPKDRILWAADGGFGDGTASTHTSAVSRRTLRTVLAATVPNQQPFAIRTCSLLDGFGYDVNGQPAPVAGGSTIDRDLRYNWMWLVQRLGDNTASQATMTVVTFDKRAPGYAPAGVPLETVWIPSAASTGATLVSFTGSYPANTLPAVQRGGWLMDASICLIDRSKATPSVVPFKGSGPLPAAAQPWIRNAQFYRVASVTETAVGIDVELEVPLRPDTGRDPDPAKNEPQLPPDQRRFIYMSGVAEVFERPTPLDLK